MHAELHCLSNFSFLRGASRPEELVARAAELGYGAIALTDECSVAGVPARRWYLRTEVSGQVFVDIERAMKHAQNGNASGLDNQVSYSVVPVKQDTNLAFGFSAVFIPNLWKSVQELRLLIDTCDYALGYRGIVGSDVVKNIQQPPVRFFGPSYFCHVRRRCFISSSDKTRPCRTSSRPRLTMRSNANSRMSSS